MTAKTKFGIILGVLLLASLLLIKTCNNYNDSIDETAKMDSLIQPTCEEITSFSKNYNPSHVSEDYSTDEWRIQAHIISQDFVKSHLKAPSTAEFGTYKCKYSSADSSFYIAGDVDAQNAFSAMLRSRYSIRLRFSGGDWADGNNWTELNFEMK